MPDSVPGGNHPDRLIRLTRRQEVAPHLVLFARKVLNDRTILTNAFQINLNIPTYNRMVVSQPLTVGVDLNYHF